MQSITIIYDGECPFCSAYVGLVRLRDNFSVRLIDARHNAAEIETLGGSTYNLDDGMLVKIGDEIFHGAEAMTALSLLTTPSGTLNRLTAAIFKSRRRARLLYPLCRTMRNLALKIKGVEPIHPQG